MEKSPFDNLPQLSQKEALCILSKQIDQLDLSSDYYKAVFHLGKYPGQETEEALLKLLERSSKEQSVVIAKRKAVEVLGNLGCIRAIPAIGRCLSSSDIYLIENAAWALKELQCKDKSLHQLIILLLDDVNQNRRVLIQSLAGMQVIESLPKIRNLMREENLSSGEYGALLAANFKLSGQRQNIDQIKKFLFLPNQNDRQCAVQDVIDCMAIDLLPSVLKSPIAPSFKIRAVETIFCEKNSKNMVEILRLLDSIIKDDHANLELVHQYESIQKVDFLVEELFSTDFSRAYLALKTLICMPKELIWPCIEFNLGKAKIDYGAIYFFVLLFLNIENWNSSEILSINNFVLSTLDNKWPSYMKFKPLAIIALIRFNRLVFNLRLPSLLDSKQNPSWQSRYAVLLGLETYKDPKYNSCYLSYIEQASIDCHRFVRSKSKSLL